MQAPTTHLLSDSYLGYNSELQSRSIERSLKAKLHVLVAACLGVVVLFGLLSMTSNGSASLRVMTGAVSRPTTVTARGDRVASPRLAPGRGVSTPGQQRQLMQHARAISATSQVAGELLISEDAEALFREPEASSWHDSISVTLFGVGYLAMAAAAAVVGFVQVFSSQDNPQPIACMAVDGEVQDEDFEARLKALKYGKGKERYGGEKIKEKSMLDLEESPQRNPLKTEMQKRRDAEDESVQFEGRPSKLELIGPAVSSLFIVGIPILIATIVRQYKVMYRISNKMIRITSGYSGDDVFEILYPQVTELKYRRKYASDDVIDLYIIIGKGGQELTGLSNAKANYEFILSQLEPEAQKRSQTWVNNPGYFEAWKSDDDF